jgi:hypothetical protein
MILQGKARARYCKRFVGTGIVFISSLNKKSFLYLFLFSTAYITCYYVFMFSSSRHKASDLCVV